MQNARVGMTQKHCGKCDRLLPCAEFGAASGRPDGMQTYCRACMNAGAAARAHKLSAAGLCVRGCGRSLATKRHCRECADSRSARKGGHGVLTAEYDRMHAAQSGRCAICGATTPDGPGRQSRRFNVDHCHVTGRIRGLLCGSCNGGLGLFRDDPARLAAAIEYLRLPSD